MKFMRLTSRINSVMRNPPVLPALLSLYKSTMIDTLLSYRWKDSGTSMTVTRLAFKLNSENNYIDLAQCLSLVQRTLVRQKQTFTVLGGQVVDNAVGQVMISTAPNFWYTKAAINRCFGAWKDQRHRVLTNANMEDTQGIPSKYADFKISLNGNLPGDNKLPIWTDGGSSRTVMPSENVEWSTSSVTDEDTQEKHFKILGNHDSNFYGSMYGWLVTRPVPNAEDQPTMPDMHSADGATHSSDGTPDFKQDYLNLLNETATGQSERLTLLIDDNDHPPFDLVNLYGNVEDDFNLQLQSYTYTSDTNPHHMIAGFKALCGLIHVKVTDGSNPILFLDVLNTPEAF